jgi:hypothetical protein
LQSSDTPQNEKRLSGGRNMIALVNQISPGGDWAEKENATNKNLPPLRTHLCKYINSLNGTMGSE